MVQTIIKKLDEYKRKYYVNKLLKGSIIGTTLVALSWYMLSSLEFGFRFGTGVRGLIFFVLLISTIAIIIYWIILPTLSLFKIGKTLSDEDASRQIGRFFPEISDKLLNTIQLQKLNQSDSSLVLASIEKRVDEFKVLPFTKAVDFSVNKKYLKYLGGVVVVFLITGLTVPKMFTESTKRIINYNKEFKPEAPFSFVVAIDQLEAFKNEDHKINIKLEGNNIPNDAFIIIGKRSIKLQKSSQTEFNYTFDKVQRTTKFQLSAAGFESPNYTLRVYSRPEINNFSIALDYPKHTKKQNERISNIGNLRIPEGTNVNWLISTNNTEALWIKFENGDSLYQVSDNQVFNLSKSVRSSSDYEIISQNEFSINKERQVYFIDVVKDEFPGLDAEFYGDTILYEYVVLAGSISDDYGLKDLKVFYEWEDKEEKSFRIPIGQSNEQTYFFRWSIDSLNIKKGSSLKVSVEVRDNDGINGFKKVRSSKFTFNVPSESTISNRLATKSKNTEKQLKQSIKETKSLNEKLKELEQRLKSNKELQWQDEKLLKDLLKQREEIQKAIEELKEEFEGLKEAEEKFTGQSEELQEKAQKLQELMNELLDEETKKLYDELQKLLEEEAGKEEIQQKLQELSPNELNLEKELERTLELFKRLKVENKIEQAGKEVEELAKEQEELAKETSEKGNDLNEVKEKQDEINQKFDEFEKELEEIEELNQELKNPEPLENFNNDREEIQKSLDGAKEQLEQQKRKQSQQQQQKAGQQMQQLGQKLQNMQQGMQMEMVQENIDNLRDIVDNLVKLSFNQEELISNFRGVRQVDPRFIELSQEQLKLKDDAKIIEDSLLSLASRVVQISSFVTREVSEMNRNINKSLEELRARNRSKALSNQQYSMTSMNNLSLLLGDVLQQMQMAMSQAMGKPQPGGDNKNGQSIGNLRQLQQQLSQQIKDLKESGVSGRKLSEQLARMAAQQEFIRNQLKEFEKQLKGQPGNEEAGNNLSEVIEELEKNEIDLVNKRISQQLIERQKKIETRLLEAEKAEREQKLDQERKAESPKNYDKQLPKAFEEYLKAKEKEVELFKTVPIELSPFYKKEVNDYFRRISKEK